jgi:type II secretory pathway component PulF
MRFQYRAKERNGRITSGEAEATSLSAARVMLRQQGLFLLQINAISEGGRAAKPFAPWNRVKKADLLMMLSQLTIMCQSGVDLSAALKSVASQCPNRSLKEVMERVSEDIQGGSTFAGALNKHPHVFDDMFVAGIASGEKTGAITDVLERLTYLIRSDLRLRQTVTSMLMYPLVLCGVTVMVVFVMFFFVLPQFAIVFEGLGTEPPPITQLLLATGEWVRGQIGWIVAAVIGMLLSIIPLRRSAMMMKLWDHISLNSVLAKKATRALATGRTFRLLGTMLTSGIPLIDSIRMCHSAARNGMFRGMFERLEREVLRGEGLGPTLIASNFLPSGAAQMVATAEQTGKLGEVLKMVGEYFEDQGERHLRDLLKLLEPVAIAFLGIVVAAVAFSIVLPLLDVSSIPE